MLKPYSYFKKEEEPREDHKANKSAKKETNSIIYTNRFAVLENFSDNPPDTTQQFPKTHLQYTWEKQRSRKSKGTETKYGNNFNVALQQKGNKEN